MVRRFHAIRRGFLYDTSSFEGIFAQHLFMQGFLFLITDIFADCSMCLMTRFNIISESLAFKELFLLTITFQNFFDLVYALVFLVSFVVIIGSLNIDESESLDIELIGVLFNILFLTESKMLGSHSSSLSIYSIYPQCIKLIQKFFFSVIQVYSL